MAEETTCKIGRETDLPPKFDLCNESYFVTSTGIGNRIIQPMNMEKRSLDYKIPKAPEEQTVILREDIKRTTYNQSNVWHIKEDDPMKFYRIPFAKVHYISKFGERVKLQPPNPFKIFKSEYQEKYHYVSVHPPNTSCVDTKNDVFCEIAGLDKDQRPLLTTGSEGYTKRADPYVSTNQLDYHEFDVGDVLKYNTKVKIPEPELSSRIKPVYDASVFRTKYIEKLLPKIINHVPHSGLETEMKGNYRMPIDEMSHFSNRHHTPEVCMPPVTGASKTEIFLVPFMYHTEYSQLGKRLNSLVCDTKQ